MSPVRPLPALQCTTATLDSCSSSHLQMIGLELIRNILDPSLGYGWSSGPNNPGGNDDN